MENIGFSVIFIYLDMSYIIMKKTLIQLFSALLPLASLAQSAPEPYGALPSARQLHWHEMELYCLIHYTPTTFQDKEWGFGDADPKIFNPSGFDADQIAQAAASAGFKGLISVAKHHDGFCLWPTQTTDYNISKSPWKNGKGDMVRDFMEATHRAGMEFGVYLSAWDRNDTRYGTPAYADAYREQLRELMTGYGPLFTSWHDGANGGDGYYGGRNERRTIDRVTYYEWEEKTWPIVREHQPMAMIFSDVGPDMRWVGNEKGFAAETSWATLTPKGRDGMPPVPGQVDPANLPTGDRGGKYWIPAECDVPQRPGWFYHANQDVQVKTPDQLFEIYLKSVGRGGAMNLGLAPMPEGVLHANDVKSLKYFGEKLRKTFGTNFAAGAQAKASSQRGTHKDFAVENIFDDDRYTYYAPADGELAPTIDISLPKAQTFDIILLSENIKLGQRMDSVRVDVYENGAWKHLASATSIGAKRLIKLETPVSTNRLRVQLFAPVVPTLSDFGLFKEHTEAFSFDESTSALKKLGNASLRVAAAKHFKTVDGDVTTLAQIPTGSEVLIQLDEPIKALGYVPRQDGQTEGLVLKYAIYASENKNAWKKIREGEFSNIRANPTEQIIDLSQAGQAKHIKFVPIEAVGATSTIAEFNIYQ